MGLRKALVMLPNESLVTAEPTRIRCLFVVCGFFLRPATDFWQLSSLLHRKDEVVASAAAVVRFEGVAAAAEGRPIRQVSEGAADWVS